MVAHLYRNPAGTALIKMPPANEVLMVGEDGQPCCCGECPCIPELEALEYPDLLVCLRSNATTPCDLECFVTEQCFTLSWNGQFYQVVGDDFGCSLSSMTMHLGCISAPSINGCGGPEDGGLTCPGGWKLHFPCEIGCFEACLTAVSCSPPLLTGTVCAVSHCCDNTVPTPAEGCLDVEVTLAP